MMTMDQMLTYLLDKEGSDLHLMAGLKPAIRRHGALEPIEDSEPFTPESVQQVIYSVLSEKQIKLYEEHPETRNELDFAYSISGMGRFRFNVHAQRGTVAAVVRALATEIPTLESLKMPPSVAKFAEVRKGLVLVTGPTGSGKSTTLAALIDLVNTSRADHIITIEDPIEYVHNSKKSYVTQREVGLTADTMSFKNALKYSLRQDPDVILVGELRDYETIGIAITSAETGHLVFGTLHTPSAAETIGRIIDVFPGDQQPQVVTQLSSNLVGVVAQILLPTLDGKGRAAAVEIMVCNSAIRNQIRTNSIDGIYQSIQTGIKQGMMTMDQSIANLVRDGRVAYEVADPYIRDESTHRQLEQFKAKNGNGAAPQDGSLSAEPSQTQAQTQAQTQPPAEPASNGDAEQPKPKTSRMSMMNAIPPWEKK